MKLLFYGAYLQAAAEIRLEPQLVEELGEASTARARFRNWAATYRDDPDLAGDVRMMVPLFYDEQRGQTKVWAILGFARHELEVSYSPGPELIDVRKNGKSLPKHVWPVEFRDVSYTLPALISVETFVSDVMTREQFRAFCDEKETFTEITLSL